jgi:predicted nuclease of predicted toxin-antitoxin system
MKILLDENVNKKLKNFLPDFEILTVKEMNWLGKSNGELLSLAVANNFNAIISNDTNIKFQQNLKKYDIYFIVIKTKDNNLESILPLVPYLNETLKMIHSQLPEEKYFEIS